jgi:hypothetical protein
VDLGRALARPPDDGWNRAFVSSFVRPHGFDRDAAPFVCDDLEAFVPSFAPAPVRRLRLARPLLALLARRMDRKAERPSRDQVVYGVDFRGRVWRRAGRRRADLSHPGAASGP